MQRKGSYFFVIDAFVASIIVIATIIVLFTQFLDRPAATQAFYTAEDFLGYLESTQVRVLDSSTARAWAANGTINDTGRSLLEQLALFKATGATGEARQLAAIASGGVPASVGMEILIDGSSYHALQADTKTEAPVFFSSKRVILLRRSPVDLYDPVIIEVQTWQ